VFPNATGRALSLASVAVAVANEGVAGHSIVLGAGSEAITGAVLSSTEIVCDAVEEFPQASVAVQVRVTEYSLAHVPAVVVLTKVNDGELSHASVAVAVANEGVAGHSIVLGAGSEEITGAVLSSTEIVCEAVDELPQASVAVQVRVTEYSLAHVPAVVVLTKVSDGELSHASVAVAVANEGVAGHSIVLGAGSEAITGAVLSSTEIVCEAVDELPQASVAVQVRVTEYSLAHVPAVVVLTKVNDGELSHASVAVAVANEGVAGHSIVLGAGSEAITGAVLSSTEIVCDAVEEFPQASVAVQVRVTEYSLAHVPAVVVLTKVNDGELSHASVAVAVANEGVAGHSIVLGAGSEEITGAVLSSTEIVCDAVDEFPQASVAVQVRVTEYSLAHVPAVVVLTKVRDGEASHASVALAVAKPGVAGHSIVLGAGSEEITGAVLSSTEIVCDAVDEFPQASVAVQVLVTEYSLAHVPAVVVLTKVSDGDASHASVAVAVANEGVAGHSIVDGAGSEAITGAVLSSTEIVCEAVDELPQASVAVQVRVTEYSLAHVPAVVVLTKVSDGELSHASVAVAVANEGVAGHSIVLGAGSEAITGAVLSSTEIVCDAVEEFPQASVAVQVRVTEYSLAHVPAVVVLTKVSDGELSHASVALAVAKP